MAKVIVIFGGEEVATHELTKPAMVIGRDPTSDIVVDNLGVSRAHCQLLRRGTAYVLQDMNSANGTWVNGERVGEHYLNDGDKIGVGKYVVVFSNPEQAAAAQAEGQRIVPDSMNTYMMDGDAIRQRLEQLKSERDSGDAAAPVAPAAAIPDRAEAAAGAGAGVAPERMPTQPRRAVGEGGASRRAARSLKVMLAVSIVLNFLFLAAVVMLLLRLRDAGAP